MSTNAFTQSIKESAARKAAGPIGRVAAAVNAFSDDLTYTKAQFRGEKLAKQMRRDGSLRERSPRKVIQPPK